MTSPPIWHFSDLVAWPFPKGQIMTPYMEVKWMSCNRCDVNLLKDIPSPLAVGEYLQLMNMNIWTNSEHNLDESKMFIGGRGYFEVCKSLPRFHQPSVTLLSPAGSRLVSPNHSYLLIHQNHPDCKYYLKFLMSLLNYPNHLNHLKKLKRTTGWGEGSQCHHYLSI